MKIYISLLLALIMVLTFTVACAPKQPSNDDTNLVGQDPVDTPDDNNGEDTQNEVVDPSPKTDSQEVTLYFANKQYIDTGDESLEKLIGETRNVEFGDTTLEEAIVRELMRGPEDTETLYTGIPSTAKLIGVEIADGTAFVNFASEGMYGGSMQESFTISQIVDTLTELDTVDRVQCLLDGKKGDSLMGHYSIEEPFENGRY